jgi:hypothetical protein
MVFGAVLTRLLDMSSEDAASPPLAKPIEPLGAMPRSREHAAVLSWIFEHRPDANNLEFLRWSPPRPVPENPFTRTPATLVKLVVKNNSGAQARLEHLFFYLQNLEVLGSISKATPEPETVSAA